MHDIRPVLNPQRLADVLSCDPHAEGHVKGRGLSGAVWPEEADDLAGIDVEAHALHYRAAAIGLGESVGAEGGHQRARGVAVHAGLTPFLVCVRVSSLPSTMIRS